MWGGGTARYSTMWMCLKQGCHWYWWSRHDMQIRQMRRTPASTAKLILSHIYTVLKQAITLPPKNSFHAGNQTLSTKFFIWTLTMQMGNFQLKLIYETVSLYDCFYWPSWRLEFMTVAAHLLFLLNFRDSIDNLSPVETSFSI